MAAACGSGLQDAPPEKKPTHSRSSLQTTLDQISRMEREDLCH